MCDIQKHLLHWLFSTMRKLKRKVKARNIFSISLGNTPESLRSLFIVHCSLHIFTWNVKFIYIKKCITTLLWRPHLTMWKLLSFSYFRFHSTMSTTTTSGKPWLSYRTLYSVHRTCSWQLYVVFFCIFCMLMALKFHAFTCMTHSMYVKNTEC